VTDQQLAAGLVAGDGAALRELVDLYHRPVLRYLWQAGGSKEDAEDLACQALLRVRAEISGYRGTGSLKGWVFRVAYRELLRHRRRQVVMRAIHRPPPRSEVRDDFIVLTQALDRLPIDQRSAFLLTEVEGLSTSEAAIALGVPPGTVKSRCHHARQKLRKLLGPTYGEAHAEPIAE
jgi:RNA polymerase sigma-70 factor (ECF subfamily)